MISSDLETCSYRTSNNTFEQQWHFHTVCWFEKLCFVLPRHTLPFPPCGESGWGGNAAEHQKACGSQRKECWPWLGFLTLQDPSGGKKKEILLLSWERWSLFSLGVGECPVCWLGRGEKGETQQGWEPAVGLQVSYKYLEILLWQGQTYCSACGWWKGKAFLQVLMGTSWTLCNLGSHPWLLEKKVSLEGKPWPAQVWESSQQLVLMSFHLPHPAHLSLLYLNQWLVSC